jgi:GT2 family glycosyltransferase
VTEPRLSVCIVTYQRPAPLRRCLASLAGQPVAEVVVVDASAAALAPGELPSLAGVVLRYRHAPWLAGWMTRSRNEALRHVDPRVDVVAFLDDDVEVRPVWADALRTAFADPTVAAVAGRTCNGLPDEHLLTGPIGRLRPDGTLSEGFAAQTGRPVEVEHGIGANMAFRRRVLGRLGGFRDDYPGTALREDTDVFLRVCADGGRVLFVPDATVDHRAAAHVHGDRFDTRYKYYARRNHLLLLARNRGLGSPELRAYLRGEVARSVRGGQLPMLRRAQRMGITGAGLVGGLLAVAGGARWERLPPPRVGPVADEIRARLA